MTPLRIHLNQLSNRNERGEFTLPAALTYIALFAGVLAITFPTMMTAQNAQVTFGVKSDVITTSALISSNLASRFYSEPVDIFIRTEGCEGEPVLMPTIPVSVASSTCLTAVGNQDGYVVTGTSYSNGKSTEYVSDSRGTVLNASDEGESPASSL